MIIGEERIERKQLIFHVHHHHKDKEKDKKSSSSKKVANFKIILQSPK
jgi:hypothetical protein